MRRWFIISVIVVVAAACAGFSFYQQHRLKKYFELRDDAPAAREYLEHDRMEDMDMERISRNTFNYARPAVKMSADYEIAAPCDIRFYEDAALKKEAKVIPKGTVLHVKLHEKGADDLGRGFFSLPTFDKGIRYTRPFLVPSEETDEHYYYVRLSDLENTVKELLKTADLDLFGNASKTMILRNRCFYVDRLFYRKGIYLSHDIRYKDIKDLIPYIGLTES